jgi:hypothetical protein
LSYNSIFIMTNYIKTEQRRDVCDEASWAIKLFLLNKV